MDAGRAFFRFYTRTAFDFTDKLTGFAEFHSAAAKSRSTPPPRLTRPPRKSATARAAPAFSRLPILTTRLARTSPIFGGACANSATASRILTSTHRVSCSAWKANCLSTIGRGTVPCCTPRTPSNSSRAIPRPTGWFKMRSTASCSMASRNTRIRSVQTTRHHQLPQIR